MTSASNASGSVTLGYDPLGRLHQVADATATTRFLYDGADVIAEYNTSGTVLRRYVHGPGADEPLVWYEGSGTSDRRWLIADERGSVIGTTNSSGTVTQVNKYDAYGVPDTGNQGRFQYTAQMWIAELGLYHYKARAYHPRLGRFMQTDSIGYAGGINLYAYVGNDPVNFTDPTGLDECSLWQRWTSTSYAGGRWNVERQMWEDVFVSNDDWECEWPTPAPESPEPAPSPGPVPSDRAGPAQVLNPTRNILCGPSPRTFVGDALETVDDVGTVADDVVRPVVAAGATAAGATSFRHGVTALGDEVAGGLSKVGRIGLGAGYIGLGLQVWSGDYRGAAYGAVDMAIYTNVIRLSVLGAIPTEGASLVVGGMAVGAYYQAGGSQGLVQSTLCGG